MINHFFKVSEAPKELQIQRSKKTLHIMQYVKFYILNYLKDKLLSKFANSFGVSRQPLLIHLEITCFDPKSM